MGRAQPIHLPRSGLEAGPDFGQPAPPPSPPLPFDRRLRVLRDTAFEAVCIVDDHRRYLRANEAATRILGAPIREIVSRRVDDFTLPEHRPELDRLWTQLHRQGSVEGPYLVAQASGSLLPIHFRATWDYAPGEHLIVALEAPLAPPPAAGGHGLTSRELQILALAANGCSNQEIGRRLVLSPATVKTHLQNTYRKLNAPDRAAAVAFALRAGLIS